MMTETIAPYVVKARKKAAERMKQMLRSRLFKKWLDAINLESKWADMEFQSADDYHGWECWWWDFEGTDRVLCVGYHPENYPALTIVTLTHEQALNATRRMLSSGGWIIPEPQDRILMKADPWDMPKVVKKVIAEVYKEGVRKRKKTR